MDSRETRPICMSNKAKRNMQKKSLNNEQKFLIRNIWQNLRWQYSENKWTIKTWKNPWTIFTRILFATSIRAFCGWPTKICAANIDEDYIILKLNCKISWLQIIIIKKTQTNRKLGAYKFWNWLQHQN